MADTELYFAYGSNMYTPRLRYRVPGASVVGLATLQAHRLRFHKRSDDGSGKCNAEYTGSPKDQVIGVLFTIPTAELGKLDKAEGRGKGYDVHPVTVATTEAPHTALTYLAASSHINEELVPYDWYWDFVVAGARLHALPEDYCAHSITGVSHRPDTRPGKDAEERAKVRED